MIFRDLKKNSTLEIAKYQETRAVWDQGTLKFNGISYFWSTLSSMNG